MTTTVVYADTSDGYIDSGQAAAGVTLSQALAGSATFAVNTTSTFTSLGPGIYSSTGKYGAYEAFLQFNTSGVGTDTVSAVVFTLYSAAPNNSLNLVSEARIYDWGTGLTSADWVAGANLGNYTLVAHYNYASTGGAWAAYSFTDDAFPANINGAGQTKIFLSTDTMRNATNPGLNTNHSLSWRAADYSGTTYDPKLTITHAAAASLPVWAQGSVIG